MYVLCLKRAVEINQTVLCEPVMFNIVKYTVSKQILTPECSISSLFWILYYLSVQFLLMDHFLRLTCSGTPFLHDAADSFVCNSFSRVISPLFYALTGILFSNLVDTVNLSLFVEVDIQKLSLVWSIKNLFNIIWCPCRKINDNIVCMNQHWP